MRTRVFLPTYTTWALVGGTSRPAGETVIAADITGDDIDVSVAACYEPGENVSNFSDTLSKEGTYKSIKHKILRIFLHYTPYITILVLSNHNQHHFWLNHVPAH